MTTINALCPTLISLRKILKHMHKYVSLHVLLILGQNAPLTLILGQNVPFTLILGQDVPLTLILGQDVP